MAPTDAISSAAAARTSYALHDGAEPLGGRDRLEARDAGAEHDDLVAGWTVPAAVMFRGKKRRSMPAATIAQR